jgi:hypothetical protein
MKFIKTFLVIVSCLCFGSLAGCSPSKSSGQPTPTASAQPGNDQTTQTAAPPLTSGEGAEGQASVSATAGQTMDELHTPPQGSAERQALMDGLREAYKGSRNSDGKPNRGSITFVVNYLKVHSGWAWVYAEPRSSDPNDQFGENSGFLLHQEDGQWKVMKLPPMVDDPDDPENLDYPAPRDIERIRKMYPSIPADIFPKAQSR